MSTLTKVFVVLLVVFSIAFTMMSVSITAQTANWRDNAQKYERLAQIAETNQKNLIAANAAQLASARDTIGTLTDALSKKEADLQRAQGDNAAAQIELNRYKAEKGSTEAINRGLVAQLQVAESERSEYRKQRDELEQQVADLSRRNIDLNDRVNEQTAALAVLQAEKQQFEQQLNLLKKENEGLASSRSGLSIGSTMEQASGAAMSGVTALNPVAATPIRGQVVEIDGTLVTLSVGSADGVESGMVFVIHRGGQDYVGDVLVSLVNPNQCAGRLVKKLSAPIPGDQVTDAAHLGARAH